MANNDRLKQIISNLQILTNLTNSMTDSEMYPVSFFSQAFDLIQKIQSDIHSLEADQVELFAAQMKKHQALILSIHQQMRNISQDTQEQKTATSVKPEEPAIPVDSLQQPNEENNEENAVVVAENETKKPTPTIIEDPIKVPTDKATVSQPAQEHLPEEAEPSLSIAENTDTTPEIPSPDKNAKTPAATKTTEVKETKAANTPVTIAETKEANAPKSLNDTMEKNKLSDLRKAFNLNDRFRYRKELFGGNEELMYKVIATLNNKKTYKESITFIEEKLHWDFSNQTVKDFVKALELRFFK